MAEAEAPAVTDAVDEAAPAVDAAPAEQAAPAVTEDAGSNKRKLDEAGAEDGCEERSFKRAVLEPATEAGADTSAEVIAGSNSMQPLNFMRFAQ